MSQPGLQKAHTAITPKLTPEPPPGFFVDEENVGTVMAHTTAVGADEIDHQHWNGSLLKAFLGVPGKARRRSLKSPPVRAMVG
jgi:hypothetical protein